MSSINRRDFLKLVGLGLAAWKTPPFLVELGLNNTTNDMELPIPREFAEIPIPQENLNLKSGADVLSDAFLIYREWNKHSSSRPIHFEQRKNYLNMENLIKKFPKIFEYHDDYNTIADLLYKALLTSSNEKAADEALEGNSFLFSAASIDGPNDVLKLDPGSGIVDRTFDVLKKEFGYSKKELLDFAINVDGKKMPNEILGRTVELVSTELSKAKEWVLQTREKLGEPISTSYLIAYFLEQNDGDLYRSMWDTTLFLKMLCRNSFDTLLASNTYEESELTGYLFKDEFSPRISLNWLIEKFKELKIPKESPLYLSKDMDNTDGKNFMPINKAGTLYHAMNLITWAATCMDSVFVEGMVLAYYNEEKIGGINRKVEHGADKVQADLLVAKNARAIKRVVDQLG